MSVRSKQIDRVESGHNSLSRRAHLHEAVSARAGEGAGRRERAWAWLSLLTLILCWDAAARLDERISPPRVRIAHVGEREEAARAAEVATAH